MASILANPITLLATIALLGVTTMAWSQQVPCFHIFGDSLVDNGNNNLILTLARANYLPYGIDFSEGVTGRFTNGLTTVDVLARFLGFRDFIPPYVTAERGNVLRGVNFASGAAGIRAETGNNLGDHYPLAVQVDHFRSAVEEMKTVMGNSTRLAVHLSKCIYFAGLGSNDYLNNYFMPSMYSTSQEYSPRTYAKLLIQDYSKQLAELYSLGARKVVIVGLGQIGCIPYELARYNGGGRGSGSGSGNGNGNGIQCNEKINRAIAMYNGGLLKMVKRFNRVFPRAKFIYVNTYDSSRDLITNAAAYGLNVIDRGCCGVGRNNGLITCLPLQLPCNDRSGYLFWDAFHPTEVANIVYARKAYNSTSTTDVYPINIRQLAMA